MWAHVDDTGHTDERGRRWAQTNEAGADKRGWAHTDKIEDGQTMAGVGVAVAEAAATTVAVDPLPHPLFSVYFFT